MLELPKVPEILKGFQMFYIEGHFPVQCPCCRAFFFYPDGEVIHDPHQLALPELPELPLAEPKLNEEQVREIHAEVAEEEGGDS